ncbi:MAG TPA: glycine betaine ABC transporter substrate-binding protein [Chthoniobacterales bacterium]|jgi:Periplasmic glycine betaine/choline-binding (lipo)protein of an ABC-type transport system (osmoprotectant binding protein)|nr:glycine betaine ABC transporter substrate-binding protein [Chthoniobacterales bacterium]
MNRIRKAGKQETVIRFLLFSCVPAFLIYSAFAAEPVRIGSKKFTESYVLGEIAKRTLGDAGISVEHREGMGGTIILWQALRGGQIDVYPEYTGTIAQEILKRSDRMTLEQISGELAKFGVGTTRPLGFNNTYALVMTRDKAQKLGVRTISDLRNHWQFTFGLTHEFLDRQDGWRPLAQFYGLNPHSVIGIDHAIGYDALRNGQVDVKDAYSTDAKIAQYDLTVIEDDRQFFPRYDAVYLYRLGLDEKVLASLRRLEGTIDEPAMIHLNAEAERTKDYALAANLLFGSNATSAFGENFWHKLARWTARHLELAGFSLLLSIIVGIPLGIWASRGGAIGQFILGFAGVVQTIPSLALLALLVPLPFFGISVRTAITALFLYGLLPIVRNTATGLQDIPRALRESAVALGLSPRARLWQIFLPMASRSILAGIKTSAVINIGTATLAALIGAGGLGEPILSGLNLNDHSTILQGAIPAAILALLVQWLFDLLDRVLIPKGLRL